MDPTDTRCSPKIVFKGSCGFEATLGNGQTRGYVGTDTFKFNEEAGYFPNIAFGCGIQNTNFTFGTDPNNQIAGVLGLGIGPRSMITQLDVDIKGRFTYCLRSDTNKSSIIFGDDAQIVGGDTVPTQSIAMNPDARYHLNLAGITVQERRLNIKPSLFTLDDQNFRSGFFIDPSAAYTVLTYTAYLELKSAILEHFSNYQMEPIQDTTTTNVFDLCYSNVPDEAKGQVYPSVTFNFVKSPGSTTGEVKLLFDQRQIFAKFENGFCLQMLSTPNSTDGPSIFGAFQQTNIQFLFDVNARMLSFVPKEC
ncbi:aspartic proteinase nepenthesin-2-like [Silene latifolia]|uniref:aspartic proteinase nepenthesin-2-like n=1 Tax=Silene latifolia TaxID=37657 RepID=UPI003D76F2B1